MTKALVKAVFEPVLKEDGGHMFCFCLHLEGEKGKMVSLNWIHSQVAKILP